jgi:hypothetical protein
MPFPTLEVSAEVLPSDKVDVVKRLQAVGRVVVYRAGRPRSTWCPRRAASLRMAIARAM